MQEKFCILVAALLGAITNSIENPNLDHNKN